MIFITFESRDKTCSKIEKSWLLLVHWLTKTVKQKQKKSTSGRPEVFCKKQVLKQIYKSKVFSCEFCEAFKNTYFVKYLRTAAFENHVHSDSIVQ